MRQLILLISLLCTGFLTAQESHRITVEIEGYEQDYLSLANNILDKQYIVDTARRDEQGRYVFESDTSALPRGIYLVVLAPNNDYFQMIVGDDPDQVFTLTSSMADLSNVKVDSSPENELFYTYLAYLSKQGDASMPAREKMRDTTLTEAEKAPYLDQLNAIDAQVTQYQEAFVNEHPASFVAAIISANRAKNGSTQLVAGALF